MVRAGVEFRELPPRTPWVVGALGVVLFVLWWLMPARTPVAVRVPGTDRAAGDAAAGGAGGDVFAAGMVVAGPGKPVSLPGSWPRFRGPAGDGISREAAPLARTWPGGKPRELWSVEVGEGYAGPVIEDGRVYLMDYDRGKGRDALRCLSLADGAEVWRFTYPVAVKRNHGLTRTVPAVSGTRVVAMGPKCHVVCVDAGTGRFHWGLDLVKDFGATVPAWYTGQCPLIVGDTVILAPGGPEALLLAADLATGAVRWKSPNPHDWKMTHASVLPFELGGRRYYLYPASGGVVAVSAADGSVAWETASWKINIAAVPTPVDFGEGRVFFTGGYNAGSLGLQFSHDDAGKLVSRELFRVKASVFGATQHTPLWFDGHLYGVRADGRMVCLSPSGQVVWASAPDQTFGLGPVMIADGLLLGMDDGGKLTLAEAGPAGFKPLAEAVVIPGEVHEAWAPFALAGGRLLARDMTRMVCLQLGR